jgi:hypothetical protein
MSKIITIAIAVAVAIIIKSFMKRVFLNPFIKRKDLLRHPFYELKRAQLEWEVEKARPFFATPEAEGLDVFLETQKKYRKALNEYNAYVRSN